MTIQAGLLKTLQSIFIDSGLASKILGRLYDNTLGTMVLLSTFSVSEVETGIYQGKLVAPIPGVSYVWTARVYTDSTFATPDPNYAPSGGEFQCVDFGVGSFEAGILVDDEETDSPILDAAETDNGVLTGEDEC